jgi:hypothetical protein
MKRLALRKLPDWEIFLKKVLPGPFYIYVAISSQPIPTSEIALVSYFIRHSAAVSSIRQRNSS